MAVIPLSSEFCRVGDMTILACLRSSSICLSRASSCFRFREARLQPFALGGIEGLHVRLLAGFELQLPRNCRSTGKPAEGTGFFLVRVNAALASSWELPTRGDEGAGCAGEEAGLLRPSAPACRASEDRLAALVQRCAGASLAACMGQLLLFSCDRPLRPGADLGQFGNVLSLRSLSLNRMTPWGRLTRPGQFSRLRLKAADDPVGARPSPSIGPWRLNRPVS